MKGEPLTSELDMRTSTAITLAMILSCGACSSNSKGNDGVTDASNSVSDSAVAKAATLVPNVVADRHRTATSLRLATAALGVTNTIGSGDGLTSLKYFISNIQLCQDLKLSGSGYSGSQGCINLYQSRAIKDDTRPTYDQYLVTRAKDDADPDRYVDLLSTDGQAKLRQPMTIEASMVGTYRFGVINFYRPIKVTGQFPFVDGSGQYFRTKSITEAVAATIDGRPHEYVRIGDTLAGATEETTYMLNNGGAWFVFQKPFEITQADIDNKTAFKIDLVFNPANFGQAVQREEGFDCAASPQPSICDPTNRVVIDMPFVRMSPVPRRVGEKTHKETYLVDYDAGSKARIELYYNDGDPEMSIQGVDSAIVYQAGAISASGNAIASSFVSQSGSVTTNDAVVALLDYDRKELLTGLSRGQNGTVTIKCVYGGPGCSNTVTEVQKTYTFAGDTIVSSD